MKITVIASGSSGNATFVQSGSEGLLIDAGISVKRIIDAITLQKFQGKVTGILVSHDHSDHARSAAALSRRLNCPLIISQKTLFSINPSRQKLRKPVTFEPGEEQTTGVFHVQTLPSPHDGKDASFFVITAGGKRFGYFSDVGHPHLSLFETLPGLNALLIESNHDIEMLKNGPYPPFLKKRIRGKGGHISNCEAAGIVFGSDSEQLKLLILAHLSEDNNSPAAVQKAFTDTLPGAFFEKTKVVIAKRNEPTGPFEVA